MLLVLVHDAYPLPAPRTVRWITRGYLVMERLTYTVSEVAELLGLSRSKPTNWSPAAAFPSCQSPGCASSSPEPLWNASSSSSSDSHPYPDRHPDDHDPSSFHDPTCNSRRPLPAIPSQARHPLHTPLAGHALPGVT